MPLEHNPYDASEAQAAAARAWPGAGGRAAVVPNDPRFPEQWHLRAVAAPLAWKRTVGSRQASAGTLGKTFTCVEKRWPLSALQIQLGLCLPQGGRQLGRGAAGQDHLLQTAGGKAQRTAPCALPEQRARAEGALCPLCQQ